MTKNEKRQICIAGIVLVLLLGSILYLLYSLPPVLKIIPVKQALENVEADRRAKALEAKALEMQSRQKPVPSSEETTAPGKTTAP